MTDAKKVTTFEDLGEVVTDVKLTRPDGRVLLVPMRTLSEQEVYELALKFPMPKPPLGEPGRWDGPNNPVSQKPKYDDPGYIKAMEDRNNAYSRRMIVRSLLMELPGDTEEAKAAALEKNIGAWASRQLVTCLNRMLGIPGYEVAETANNFQPGADSGTSDLPGTGLDTGNLATVATNGQG